MIETANIYINSDVSHKMYQWERRTVWLKTSFVKDWRYKNLHKGNFVLVSDTPCGDIQCVKFENSYCSIHAYKNSVNYDGNLRKTSVNTE